MLCRRGGSVSPWFFGLALLCRNRHDLSRVFFGGESRTEVAGHKIGPAIRIQWIQSQGVGQRIGALFLFEQIRFLCYNTNMRKIIVITVLTAILLSPLTARARFFDPNDIFTDKELFDSNALSRTAIQQFLEAKGSVLKGVTALVNGVPKLVSEMIYEIGQQYGVSQKFLLAKLQHEQGLIEKQVANQNALDWATGYSCFNKRCNEKYRGIYAQLDAAADTQRIYAERTYFNYAVGKETKTTDNFKVKPANQATANLYIYTPYQGGPTGIGGNYFFWRVWNRYFTERSYADGALLKDETGNYWKVENNKLRQFVNPDIYLKDYQEQEALSVASQRLAYYQIGALIEFANNTVVRAAGSNLLYLLSNNTKQRIAGDQALALLGYHLADTTPLNPIIVDDAKLAAFTEGEPITEQSVYPQGLLAQNENGDMFLIKQGKRYPLLDQAVWQINFKSEPPLRLSNAEINKYPAAEPIKLRDGAIVKSSSGNFYVIANGEKHLVTKAEIISRVYGADAASSAPLASDAVLALHKSADAIDYINAAIPDPADYVSYADRIGYNNSLDAAPAYLAIFDKLMVPSTLETGATSTAVTVSFRNRGATAWLPDQVYFTVYDDSSDDSSFLADGHLPLSKTIAPDGTAEFSFTLKAPGVPGLYRTWFALSYKSSEGVLIPIPGAKVAKDITVMAPISAQIVKHNLPKQMAKRRGVKNIAVTIKNTSQKQIWTSRRTALILTDSDGRQSPFYDRYDWVTKDVVGVPVNRAKIKPGETGIVYFRLDARKAAIGDYILRFSMELRDVKESVAINNQIYWEVPIKVVK